MADTYIYEASRMSEEVRDGYLGDLPEKLRSDVVNVHKMIADYARNEFKQSKYNYLNTQQWAKEMLDRFLTAPADKSQVGSVRLYKKGKRYRCMIQITEHVTNHRNTEDEEFFHGFIRNVHTAMRGKIRRKYDVTLTCESEHGEQFEGFDIWTKQKTAKDLWTLWEDKKSKVLKESADGTEYMVLGVDELPDGLQQTIYETYFMLEDVLEEKSHGKIKYDFRKVFDWNTGHALKVVYDMDNIEVTGVGYGYTGHDPEKQKEQIDYLNKNIKRVGNGDHASRNQKVLAIVDRVTGQRLPEAEVIGPFSYGGLPSRDTEVPEDMLQDLRKNPEWVKRNVYKIKEGEVDKESRFKSTHWFNASEKDLELMNGVVIPKGKDNTGARGASIESLKDLSMGSAKLNDIANPPFAVVGQKPVFKHPSKKDIRDNPDAYKDGKPIFDESYDDIDILDEAVDDDSYGIDMSRLDKVVNKVFMKYGIPTIAFEGITREQMQLGNKAAILRDAMPSSMTETKFGGCPFWPIDVPYPTSHGKPMVMVAQINFQNMLRPIKLDRSGLMANIPDKGLLQVYMTGDPSVHDMKIVYHGGVYESDPGSRTIHVNPTALPIPIENTTLGQSRANGNLPVLGVYYPFMRQTIMWPREVWDFSKGMPNGNSEIVRTLISEINKEFGTTFESIDDVPEKLGISIMQLMGRRQPGAHLGGDIWGPKAVHDDGRWDHLSNDPVLLEMTMLNAWHYDSGNNEDNLVVQMKPKDMMILTLGGLASGQMRSINNVSYYWDVEEHGTTYESADIMDEVIDEDVEYDEPIEDCILESVYYDDIDMYALAEAFDEIDFIGMNAYIEKYQYIRDEKGIRENLEKFKQTYHFKPTKSSTYGTIEVRGHTYDADLDIDSPTINAGLNGQYPRMMMSYADPVTQTTGCIAFDKSFFKLQEKEWLPILLHEIGHIRMQFQNGNLPTDIKQKQDAYYKDIVKKHPFAMLGIHGNGPAEIEADMYAANIVGKEDFANALKAYTKIMNATNAKAYVNNDYQKDGKTTAETIEFANKMLSNPDESYELYANTAKAYNQLVKKGYAKLNAEEKAMYDSSLATLKEIYAFIRVGFTEKLETQILNKQTFISKLTDSKNQLSKDEKPLRRLLRMAYMLLKYIEAIIANFFERHRRTRMLKKYSSDDKNYLKGYESTDVGFTVLRRNPNDITEGYTILTPEVDDLDDAYTELFESTWEDVHDYFEYENPSKTLNLHSGYSTYFEMGMNPDYANYLWDYAEAHEVEDFDERYRIQEPNVTAVNYGREQFKKRIGFVPSRDNPNIGTFRSDGKTYNLDIDVDNPKASWPGFEEQDRDDMTFVAQRRDGSIVKVITLAKHFFMEPDFAQKMTLNHEMGHYDDDKLEGSLHGTYDHSKKISNAAQTFIHGDPWAELTADESAAKKQGKRETIEGLKYIRQEFNAEDFKQVKDAFKNSASNWAQKKLDYLDHVYYRQYNEARRGEGTKAIELEWRIGLWPMYHGKLPEVSKDRLKTAIMYTKSHPSAVMNILSGLNRLMDHENRVLGIGADVHERIKAIKRNPNLRESYEDEDYEVWIPFDEASTISQQELTQKKAMASLAKPIIGSTSYNVTQTTANTYATFITKNLLPYWAQGFNRVTITLVNSDTNTIEFKIPKVTPDFVSRFIEGRESINGFIHRDPVIRIRMAPRIFKTMKNPDDAYRFFKAAIRYYASGLSVYGDRLAKSFISLDKKTKQLIATTDLAGTVTLALKMITTFDNVRMTDVRAFNITSQELNNVASFIRSIPSKAKPNNSKEVLDGMAKAVKGIKECTEFDENMSSCLRLVEATDALYNGKMDSTLSKIDDDFIRENTDTTWPYSYKDPQIRLLAEKHHVKKLKKIPSDLIAYIEITRESIRDETDKYMIASYTISKIDIVEWYIELIDSKSPNYIVPHSRPYLVSLRTQLLSCYDKIMKTPIPKKQDNTTQYQGPVGVPPKYQG